MKAEILLVLSTYHSEFRRFNAVEVKKISTAGKMEKTDRPNLLPENQKYWSQQELL